MQTIHTPSVKDVSRALKSGRARLAGIDLDQLQRSATTMARSAVPAAFAPPVRRRRRWPIAGALIVLAVAIVGILYMSPMVQRHDDIDDDFPEPERTPTPGAQQADPLRPDFDAERDASDVVSGPVGSASLRDPSSAPDEGADLEQLAGVELNRR